MIEQSLADTLRRKSMVPLGVLGSLPRSLPTVVTGALLIGGLVTTGVVSSLLLLVVAVFLGWLALLSWPAIGVGGRVLRVAGTAVVAAYAVSRLF